MPTPINSILKIFRLSSYGVVINAWNIPNLPFKESALEYHTTPTPEKNSIQPTKPLANKLDLSLAYSPGVAHACEPIVEELTKVVDVTSRDNLVAVVTHGTAVLDLGSIGPLAAKPVM